VRLEGRYGLIFNNHPVAGLAGRARGRPHQSRRHVPVRPQAGEKLPEEQQPVADTGPDSDGDGVPDSKDQCPDTPKWARADARGCLPDNDSDGIDDSKERVPRHAGRNADRCEGLRGAVAAAGPGDAAAGRADRAGRSPDEDKDGVPDASDKCPHTGPRMDVDANGCIKPEDVTLHNVHFDIDSARLTADGYTLLRQVAASMKAQPDLRLEVIGLPTATGPDKHNQVLSQRRAQVVASS